MMCRGIVSFLLTAFAVGGAWASPVEIGVSPDGNVRSLEVALGRVRELRRSGALERDVVATIRVASGRYSCTNTIELTDEDSNLRIVGAEDGGTVFEGAVVLGTYSCGPDGIWRTEVPKGIVFDQLWVNGTRAQRARTPNRHFLYMKERDDSSPSGAFYAFPDDLAGLIHLPKEELSRVLVDYWMSWDMGYARILSIDSGSGLVKVDRQDRYGFFNWDKTHPRYALENYRAALDAPGEWFLDASASELLYIPRKGEILADARACVPVVKTIIRLKGDARNGARLRNVTIENVGLEYTSLPMEGKGIPSGQAAVNVSAAALEVEGADGFSFVRGHVAHAGGHGVWFRKGTVNARIEHALIEDLGAGGVYFGDGNRDEKRPDLDCANLSLSNSIVRAGGRILNGAVGVWLGHVHDCWVVHNEICDFFYTGVSFGWVWGYGPTVTRRNHIDFNHVHHIQQGRLSDGGAVYALGNQEGSTVCNNWIHDVNGYRDNGSPAWGLYTDEGAAGVFLASNLVERCRSGAVHQHYGRENVFRNNIFALFDEAGVWRSRLENHVTMRIENNVFWWTNAVARTYRVCGGSGFLPDLVVDGNVYWCPAADVEKADKVFNGENWEGWREKGADAHGAVADPCFVDALHGDWTLRPDSSPAKTGFRPFDWTEAGVDRFDVAWRREAARRTWEDFADAPKAPRYQRRQTLCFDCENAAVGVLRNAMGSLSPLSEDPGRPGGLAIVDQDAAQGEKALKFVEMPGMPHPWEPMADATCRFEDGQVLMDFSVKAEKGAVVTVETRDYDNAAPRPYLVGMELCLKDEVFLAEGKPVCKVPNGVWADVRVAFRLDADSAKRWVCQVTPRGGESAKVVMDQWRDQKFSHLTWVGFMSFGPEGSTWYLDDIRIRKVK
ncbi:MAG: right-handed parallel beta-helix repeat-containing protein [bacterium]|nr:right-handed parallel beta-helix repeat-containing protein [Candidatus Colisoma equi]